jgi:hypothetical protein
VIQKVVMGVLILVSISIWIFVFMLVGDGGPSIRGSEVGSRLSAISPITEMPSQEFLSNWVDYQQSLIAKKNEVEDQQKVITLETKHRTIKISRDGSVSIDELLNYLELNP